MALSGWAAARIGLGTARQQVAAARLQTNQAEAQAQQAQQQKAVVERQVQQVRQEAQEAKAVAQSAQQQTASVKQHAEQVENEKAAQHEQKTNLERDSVEEMAKKTDEAKDPSEEKWQKLFVHEIRISADVAKAMVGPSRVIVVASGKGGVGKSTISLGLLEYYSRFGPTLLVDFDMPNRGLTSLLRDDEKAYVNVLSELTRFASLPNFREMFPESRIATAEAAIDTPPHRDQPGRASLADLNPPDDEKKRLMGAFRDLADAFVDSGIGLREFPVRRFQAEHHIAIKGETAVISAKNCLFMPSVKRGDLFLSSPVFNATFSEVFYFIRCLSYWALRKEKIGTIILDCHGAHDLFMVGAIHAATELVVVMTPDPGSFDGTYDLLAFAERLNKKTTAVPAPIALVINNCRDWQEASMQVIKGFFKEKSPIKPGSVIGIKAAEDIRLVGSKYMLGRASQSQLWAAIGDLGEFYESSATDESAPLKRADPTERPTSQKPDAASSKPAAADATGERKSQESVLTIDTSSQEI